MVQEGGGDGGLYKTSKMERKQGQGVEGDYSDDLWTARQVTNRAKHKNPLPSILQYSRHLHF